MFTNFVKAIVDTAVPTSKVGDALKLALTNHRGPVQINAQFDMPLMPDDVTPVIPKFEVVDVENHESDLVELELPAHGVLVIGDAIASENISKLDEIPYDFIRKRLSILVSCGNENLQITKGALKNILDVCTMAELADSKTIEIKSNKKSKM